MPTDRIRVSAVTPLRVKGRAYLREFKTVYEIQPARDPDVRGWSPVYQTFSEWIAALCLRAKQTDNAIDVTWKHGRYGSQDVVWAELVQEDSHATRIAG